MISIQAVFKKQIDVFVEEKLDFVLCEVCKTWPHGKTVPIDLYSTILSVF